MLFDPSIVPAEFANLLIASETTFSLSITSLTSFDMFVSTFFSATSTLSVALICSALLSNGDGKVVVEYVSATGVVLPFIVMLAVLFDTTLFPFTVTSSTVLTDNDTILFELFLKDNVSWFSA